MSGFGGEKRIPRLKYENIHLPIALFPNKTNWSGRAVVSDSKLMMRHIEFLGLDAMKALS